MVTKLLNYPITQILLSSLIVLGAMVCVFTPNYYLFISGSHFAVQIMLSYLVLGVIFLIFQQPKLTFTSFVCCAGLCLFLKETTNAKIQLPVVTNSTILHVGHFNLASAAGDYEEIIDKIKASDVDLVSIQELTPDWFPFIKEKLASTYPHQMDIVRVDPYGLAVFSKYPINNLDTFYYEDIPNLTGVIKKENNQPIHFIAGHTTPPLYQSAYNKMQGHLHMIADYANKVESPLIVLGDFYAPPWCSEIQYLKNSAQLNDSRRSSNLNIGHIFENPVDYILHSDQLNCVGFSGIINQKEEHIGIQGAYQIKAIE